MARKSFSNMPIDSEKIDIPSPPEVKQAEDKPKKGGKKWHKILITAGRSITIHSQRYTGVQLWAEDDIRLEAAKGEYRLLEIIEG